MQTRLRIADTHDLRKLIAEIGQGIRHGGRITEKIMGMDPDRAALCVIGNSALPDYSRKVIARPGRYPDPDPEDVGPLPDGQDHPLFSRNPSAKWARASGAAYRRSLNRTVAVTDDASADRKRLGECTIEDLTYVRDFRYSLAAANQARGDEADRLIAALRKHGVETVDELPDAVVQACVIVDAPHES